uniref:PAT complex subunit CCDC47 n=1 Tax=Phallusia mammillata TaxID=59560 RepID=A0A6F9D9E2_9ASCI|nr:coiled-coil domain-containing protein 47-like [Phallusia mammillata]
MYFRFNYHLLQFRMGVRLRIVSCVLLLLLFHGSFGNQQHGSVDVEDNEFAEFEDFDETPEGNNQQAEVIEDDDDDDDIIEDESKPDAEENDEEDEAVVETEDDEFDTLDPDEFEGLPGDDTIWENDKKGKRGKKGKSEPELQIAKVPMHLRSWDKYFIEILMVAGLSVYLINFFIGKTKNGNIASAWLKCHLEFLQTQFELVGDDPQSKKGESTHQLNKESEHNYTFWCSGRLCCEGMLVEIKLLKRQDLISIISHRLSPVNEQVTISINLEDMDPFVFCVGTKKSIINLQKNLQDVSLYCTERFKPADKYSLSSDFCILSELYGEVPNAILDNKITKVISENQHLFESLMISDQYSGPKPNDQDEQPGKIPETEKVIIMTLNIPDPSRGTQNIAEMLPLLKMAIYLIDKVKRYRLSRENKNRADKHRQEVMMKYLKQTHAQRQEAAQLKKEEKAKALKERMMNEEDPEKQRKLDEQIHRREVSKKNKKMMKGRQYKVKAM